MMITRIDGRILGFSLPESWALLVLIAAGPPGAPVFFVLLSTVEIMPSKAQKCVRSRPTGGYLE